MVRVMAKASEFGGTGVRRSGVFPAPHIPTASEQHSLMLRTGDPSGLTDPDNGEIFSGFREESAQRATREAEGALVKGQVVDELMAEAAGEIAALQAEAIPE